MPLKILHLESGQTHEVESNSVIGRLGGNNDIPIDDPGVSARHALFRLGTTHWLLEDLGSSNGTFHEEIRLQEPLQLRAGSQFRLHRQHFEVLEATPDTNNELVDSMQTVAMPAPTEAPDTQPIPLSNLETTQSGLESPRTPPFQRVPGSSTGMPGAVPPLDPEATEPETDFGPPEAISQNREESSDVPKMPDLPGPKPSMPGAIPSSTSSPMYKPAIASLGNKVSSRAAELLALENAKPIIAAVGLTTLISWAIFFGFLNDPPSAQERPLQSERPTESMPTPDEPAVRAPTPLPDTKKDVPQQKKSEPKLSPPDTETQKKRNKATPYQEFMTRWREVDELLDASPGIMRNAQIRKLYRRFQMEVFKAEQSIPQKVHRNPTAEQIAEDKIQSYLRKAQVSVKAKSHLIKLHRALFKGKSGP